MQQKKSVIRNRGGLVSRTIAMAETKSMTAHNPQYNLGHIDIDSCAWAKGLFKRMGLTKRMSTTGKIGITAGAKKTPSYFSCKTLLRLQKEQYLSEPHNELDQTPS